MIRRPALLWLALLVGLWLVPVPVTAHPQAMSGARVLVAGERVDVGFDFDGPTLAVVLAERLDLDGDGRVVSGEIAAGKALVLAYLAERFRMDDDGEDCEPVGDGRLEAEDGVQRVRVWRSYACAAPLGTLRIVHEAFLEDQGGHRHVTQVRVGSSVHEKVLKNDDATLELDASGAPARPAQAGRAWLEGESATAPPTTGGTTGSQSKPGPTPAETETLGSTFTAFLVEGVRHILIGIDHVLFVLALVLVVATVKELAVVVTSFAVAHSVTLALGAMEVVALPARFVESMIALSIVWVAVENVLREAPKGRAAITFGFGLLHGFGFSSVLRDVGLPTDRLVSALFAFNVGVELGQLAVVLPLFPLVLWLRRRPTTFRRSVRWLSGGIAAVATAWLVERMFDLELVPL